uniref:6phosphofructo2kinase/fructose-2, 6-biphosphatase-like [Danio rerio] n=1 Tax=Lepeophtheirus salmonis TaxID=72036 RepID=A0A0K2SYY0_LEPSM
MTYKMIKYIQVDETPLVWLRGNSNKFPNVSKLGSRYLATTGQAKSVFRKLAIL